ncbi:MAG: PEP-CTERM sorting domain-containing protein [Candidatus Auribacterota bacterium]
MKRFILFLIITAGTAAVSSPLFAGPQFFEEREDFIAATGAEPAGEIPSFTNRSGTTPTRLGTLMVFRDTPELYHGGDRVEAHPGNEISFEGREHFRIAIDSVGSPVYSVGFSVVPVASRDPKEHSFKTSFDLTVTYTDGTHDSLRYAVRSTGTGFVGIWTDMPIKSVTVSEEMDNPVNEYFFDFMTGNASASFSAVPEPMSIILIGIGILGVLHKFVLEQ